MKRLIVNFQLHLPITARYRDEQRGNVGGALRLMLYHSVRSQELHVALIRAVSNRVESAFGDPRRRAYGSMFTIMTARAAWRTHGSLKKQAPESPLYPLRERSGFSRFYKTHISDATRLLHALEVWASIIFQLYDRKM